MKKLCVILVGVIMLSSFSILKTNADYVAAVKVAQADFDQLTSAFQAAYPNATLGGNFTKSDVVKLLNSMPDAAQFVNFRFCKDPDLGKTSLALCGAKSADQPDSEIKCARNGGNPTAFCPTACNLVSPAGSNSMAITKAQYDDLSATFQAAYPNRTAGGNIDKAALLDIANSLPADNANIAFRFFKDASSGKVGVIFVGGAVNQGNNGTLYLRNGATVESFCPNNCNRN